MCEDTNNMTEHEVVQYDPNYHDVTDLIAEQAAAVKNGEAQMLPWAVSEGKLLHTEDLPIYIAALGSVGVAMGTFNAVYREGAEPVTELGGAFVSKTRRGKGIHRELIAVRVDYMAQRAGRLVVFANTDSLNSLQAAGFVKAQPEHVPRAAFALCSECPGNNTPDIPKNMLTCCDSETILELTASPDVAVV